MSTTLSFCLKDIVLIHDGCTLLWTYSWRKLSRRMARNWFNMRPVVELGPSEGYFPDMTRVNTKFTLVPLMLADVWQA